ncbi:MAG: hypothetical protein E7313_04650 [Clostridiales bacterium]|nr:hypothetical protein [Clostridiales bacterium]
MNIKKLKSVFEEKGMVKFKLYGLEYTIQKVDDGVVIFADLYDSKKEKYDDVDLLLKQHYIYGENIEDNEERILNIY